MRALAALVALLGLSCSGARPPMIATSADPSWAVLTDVDLVVHVRQVGQHLGVRPDCAAPCAARLQVQKSVGGSCVGSETIVPKTPLIFYDGFQSGDTSAWSTTPRWDGRVRVHLWWPDGGCAGRDIWIETARTAERVRLDGACEGVSDGVYAGHVLIRAGRTAALPERLWGTLTPEPAGLLVFRRAQ